MSVVCKKHKARTGRNHTVRFVVILRNEHCFQNRERLAACMVPAALFVRGLCAVAGCLRQPAAQQTSAVFQPVAYHARHARKQAARNVVAKGFVFQPGVLLPAGSQVRP